jgi:hypothetical protein
VSGDAFRIEELTGVTRTTGRVGGLVGLALGLFAAAAAAQERTPAPGSAEPRLSLEGAAGLHVSYRGSMQSVAFGFAPTRSLTLLLNLARSYVRDEIDFYEDGYAIERGGTETFVSGELRYAFLARARVAPFVLGGFGRGRWKANVSEFFPEVLERDIHVVYYGGGVRIPVRPWLDAVVDARFIMALEAASDYFAVRFPVRAGVAWRF